MQAKIPLGHSGWRTGLLFAWAIWWGGLSFYALFVVPIGTEIVGGFEQGLITQRVTNWLNAIGVIVTLGFGVDVWLCECNRSMIVTWLLVTISDFYQVTIWRSAKGHAVLDHWLTKWRSAFAHDH